jgi:putative endonuclease
MNNRAKGFEGEKKALEFLENNGYKIVDKNFYTKFGEIDIIAYKNNTYHFIEVKSGKTFEPVYNITPKKLQRIIKSAYVYMKKYKISEAFCIDAVIVKDNIEFIENITL